MASNQIPQNKKRNIIKFKIFYYLRVKLLKERKFFKHGSWFNNKVKANDNYFVRRKIIKRKIYVRRRWKFFFKMFPADYSLCFENFQCETSKVEKNKTKIIVQRHSPLVARLMQKCMMPLAVNHLKYERNWWQYCWRTI